MGVLLCEGFRPPFSKGGAVKGAEPLSLSAESETLSTAFLFVSFFFVPFQAKKKRLTRAANDISAARRLGWLNCLLVFVYVTFCLDRK